MTDLAKPRAGLPPAATTVQASSSLLPYRPSNGSEGDWFVGRWCERCVKAKPCAIVGRSMAHSIGEPGYPRQWVQDDDGPRCTAYSGKKPEPSNTIRDKRQIGLPL